MKVLQVGKYFSPVAGGMETVVTELCMGLVNSKQLEIHCLVSNNCAKTSIENFHGVHLTRAATFGTLASTPLNPTMGFLAKNIHPDIIHFHLPNPTAHFIFCRTTVPYVVTYHCDIVSYPLLSKLYQPWLNQFLKNSKKIIVSSQSLINSSPVLRNFKDKCIAIPFAITTEHLEVNPYRVQLKEALKSKYRRPIILFVGRLVEYKGLEYLIQAMVDIDAELLIIGKGPQNENLKALVKGLNLESKIHFLGFIPQQDLGAYYKICDIFALPSVDEREAFGMCLLEALACGKPLLTTNIKTGVTEVNVHNHTGITVDPRDSTALNTGLKALLQNQALREDLGRGAKRHFQNNFQQEKMIQMHLDLYRQILTK